VRAVAFDVEGPWGLFRKPYAPLSPVSFPFPPPTAVLGLAAAILGYGKHEYAERIGWRDLRVGVRLRGPVRTMRAAINLLNTKDGVDALWRPKIDSHRMQIPFEFLVDPAYRIWLAGMAPASEQELIDRLERGDIAYTPVLGLANCLATVRYIGSGTLEPLGKSADQSEIHAVVPLEDGGEVHYEPERPYQRLRVPASMDGDRVVHRHPEVVVADDARALRASGITRHRLGDDVFCLI